MIDVGDRVDRFSDALVKGVKISSSLLRTLWALPDAMKWLMVCFNQSPITSFCGRVCTIGLWLEQTDARN